MIDLFFRSLETIGIILYAPIVLALFGFVVLMFISQFMDFPWKRNH